MGLLLDVQVSGFEEFVLHQICHKWNADPKASPNVKPLYTELFARCWEWEMSDISEGVQQHGMLLSKKQ